jgi:hypothetical protein
VLPPPSRIALYIWGFVVCPTIGWLIAFVWVGGTDPLVVGIVVFLAAPAFLAVIGGVLAGVSTREKLVIAGSSSALALISAFATYAIYSSQGAFQ